MKAKHLRLTHQSQVDEAVRVLQTTLRLDETQVVFWID